MAEGHVGPCHVFIRVVAPDGTVFDAIGTSEEVTIHRETIAVRRKVVQENFYYADIHIDIKDSFLSRREDPVHWESPEAHLRDNHGLVGLPVGPDVKRLGPGDAGHSA